MADYSGPMRRTEVIDVLRALRNERQSGLLSFALSQGRAEDLFFQNGSPYLAPSHPLAGRLTEAVDRNEELDGLCRVLIENLRDSMGADARFRFVPDPPSTVRPSLIGPLPVELFLFRWATTDLGEDEALGLTDPDRKRMTVRDEAALAALPELGSLGRNLLSHFADGATIGSAWSRWVGQRAAIARLAFGLEAVGLLGTPVAPDPAEADLGGDLFERLERRVAHLLAEKPIDLDPEEHRKAVAALMTRLGGDHYEVLDLSTEASSAEIAAAYEEIAKLVHPSVAEGAGLADKQSTLSLLFERVTLAYFQLSDPDRRRAYHVAEHISLTDRVLRPEERRKESEELAREKFEQAKEFIDAEDYHAAVEILREVVRLDPQPHYWALMGDVQSENPQWLDRAILAYEQAVQLQNDAAELHCRLGELHEERGNTSRAEASYMSALERMEGHQEATEGLARLRETATGVPASGEGVFGRLKRALGLRGS